MKRTIILLFLFIVSCALTAQVISNPNDRIYEDMEKWERQGFISNLPGLKPYPAGLVLNILKEVISEGDAVTIKKAKNYLNLVDKDFDIKMDYSQKNRTDFDNFYNQTSINIWGSGFINDLIFIDSMSNLMAVDITDGNVLPKAEKELQDYIIDQTDLTVMGRTILLTPGLNNTISFSKGSFHTQIGLSRDSFGPNLHKNIVLSPESPQSGQISFYWSKGNFYYSQLFKTLTATPDDGNVYDEDGDLNEYPDKYLNLHALEWNPNKWFKLTYFESVIFGERIDPLYFLPTQEYLYTSIYEGNGDNLLLGGSLEFHLPHSIKINSTLFADDLHLIDMLMGDFDTKYKAAFENDISWTPGKLIENMNMRYAAVMPYMYTHRKETYSGVDHPQSVNYLNYTHRGTGLGTSLEPNSDSLSLSVNLNPKENLYIEVWGSYSRHGDASEDISGYYMKNPDYDPDDPSTGDEWIIDPDRVSDGSYFDSGYDYMSRNHLFNSTNFLNQDILETTILSGIELTYKFPLQNNGLHGSLKYTVESISNKNCVEHNDTVNHYVEIGAGITY